MIQRRNTGNMNCSIGTLLLHIAFTQPALFWSAVDPIQISSIRKQLNLSPQTCVIFTELDKSTEPACSAQLVPVDIKLLSQA